jgi:hypothetical protein
MKDQMQPVKIFKITIMCVSLALGLASQAGATLYEISFNDGNGDIGSGQIDVASANNNFYADSGYLDVTGGGATGYWTLYTAGGSVPYPGYMYSPSGGYIYNNAVYPSGQNPEYPGTDSLLDYYGLLFTQNNGNELNLWGNSDGTYTLGGNIGGYQNFDVNIGFGGDNPGGGISGDDPSTGLISVVPEPITWALGIFGAGSAVPFAIQRRRDLWKASAKMSQGWSGLVARVASVISLESARR